METENPTEAAVAPAPAPAPEPPGSPWAVIDIETAPLFDGADLVNPYEACVAGVGIGVPQGAGGLDVKLWMPEADGDAPITKELSLLKMLSWLLAGGGVDGIRLEKSAFLVGHNIEAFDIPFIRCRAALLGEAWWRRLPGLAGLVGDSLLGRPRALRGTLDTLRVWQEQYRGGTGASRSLAALSAAMGVGTGKQAGDGARWYAMERSEQAAYLAGDIETTWRVAMRLVPDFAELNDPEDR